MSDPREEKLPRWARELLAKERQLRRVSDLKLHEHLRSVEPSQIWHGSYDNKVYVPTDYGYQTVYFSTTGQPTTQSYDEIGVSYRKGQLEVQGGRGLVIQPTASNVVQIDLR